MHEISLIQNLLECVLPQVQAERSCGRSVQGLAITIGAMELHSEEAFRQAFATEAKDTALAGAELELTILTPQANCPSCNFHGPIPPHQADPHNLSPIIPCPQCHRPAELQGGKGVGKIELILSD